MRKFCVVAVSALLWTGGMALPAAADTRDNLRSADRSEGYRTKRQRMARADIEANDDAERRPRYEADDERAPRYTKRRHARHVHRGRRHHQAARRSVRHAARHRGRTVRRAHRHNPVRAAQHLGGSSISGVASYYYSGHTVASGARFNPDGLTAAHRTLPFGTRVRVTHAGTGRSVNVTINDRGPFIGGRIIDLSRGAANVIGMIGQGLARVTVTILGR